MATAKDHFAEAERLLARGVEVVEAIGVLADTRAVFNTDDRAGRADYWAATAQMDELGKKAMGLWAQAQVHATLATIPFQQVDFTYAGEVGR